MSHVKLSNLHQNLELYYEVHGSGEIKILFIMGLLTECNAWNCQVKFFRQYPQYQCVIYDNRGCGRSSTPFTFQYSTTQMAKDALALIDHLKWSKCHVVGVSMGGMIALEFALIAPERILSLTLMATHAGGFASIVPYNGCCHLYRSFAEHDEHLKIEYSLAKLYGTKTLGDSKKKQHLYNIHSVRNKNRILPSTIGTIGQALNVALHYVSYSDLLKIRYSPFDCLIIIGTEDQLIPEINAHILQRVLGCRLLRIEGAGHGLPIECAEEINEELLNWYESMNNNNNLSNVKEKIPEEYKTEIKAVEQCCQHRTHCLVHNISGMIKGLALCMILYILLSAVGLSKGQLLGIHFTFKNVLLFGYLNGLYRSIVCVYNAFRARQYVKNHRLLLDRAAHHGGIGVALAEESKNGIPYGCGFEYPIHSIIFIISLITLMYSTRIYIEKN